MFYTLMQGKIRKGIGYHLFIWSAGFIIALCLAWLAGALLLDSVVIWEKDEQVGYIMQPGTKLLWSTEGWAVTVPGRYGIIGIPDITRVIGPKVVFWGDSYVEAFQVPHAAKMYTQFTSLWAARSAEKLTGAGIGLSGRNLGDYFHLIPRYRPILGESRLHVIVMTMKDTLPDGWQIVNDLVMPFRDHELPVRHAETREFFYKFGLSLFWNIWRDKPTLASLRFKPGPAAPATGSSKPAGTVTTESELPLALWQREIELFKERIPEPCLFLYIPECPSLKAGKINPEDPTADLAAAFAEICRQQGVGFINMQARFLRVYEETGSLPRGFNNGKPGTGHLNYAGHRAAAEAVYDYLEP